MGNGPRRVPHCEHEPRSSRFIAKPIGTFSIAGAQPKVVATEIVVCDDCWATIRAADPDVVQADLERGLGQGRPGTPG